MSIFKDKTLMITGGTGSFGNAVLRRFLKTDIKEIRIFSRDEKKQDDMRHEYQANYPEVAGKIKFYIGDVRNRSTLKSAVRGVDYIFHAAALKQVPSCEFFPMEAVKTNVIGTDNVLDAAIDAGVKCVICLSTDKAVNPTNIMGCTKRLAEIYVQSLGLALEAGKVQGKTKFVTTRFGNVLGSNGSVIPRFREQIEKGGPVTVTDPRITRYFMTIPEACRLVMEAMALSRGNQIFAFDMGESVKIDDLARKMISLAGLKVGKDIEIEYTGLRPGEKLYEEVLSNAENTEPTSHDRIRIARVRQYEYADAKAVVDKLEVLSHNVEIPEMVMLMKKTVPEFKSVNSRFCMYD